MENTIKLYDTYPYETEFDATVTEVTETKKGYEIILDQTLFFPEEGGQTPDRGTINGIEVTHVKIKNDLISHIVSSKIEPGEKIHGVIDWNHRFSNMQQHSGEHIFSGLVHGHFGYDNVGFHLSDQVVTMDFNGILSKEQLMQIEDEANQVIAQNKEIEVSYPSKEQLKEMEYRSKIEIDGQVRIVTVPGVDVCACCAPHVKRTGEIAILKVISCQNYKGGVRVSILCGKRARKDYDTKHNILNDLIHLLSVKQENLEETVAKMKDEMYAFKQQLSNLKMEAMKKTIARLPKDAIDVVVFTEESDGTLMRNAVNEMMEEHPGYCGMFAGNDNSGYRYIIGSKEKDCRELGNCLKERWNARGGGKTEMIQGSVTAKKEELEKLF